MADDDFDYGGRTLELLAALTERGVNRATLVMRHGAREYVPGRHDLENPLTDLGRAHAEDFGRRLDPRWRVRVYASPVQRCLDTGTLLLAGHLETGGESLGSVRAMEALGIFYSLDQMRMFKAMQVAGGLEPFVDAWASGALGRDVVMPTFDAARALTDLLAARLGERREAVALDVCVSHDITLYLLRDRLLGLDRSHDTVRYLDGVALWEEDGVLHAMTHDADAAPVDPARLAG